MLAVQLSPSPSCSLQHGTHASLIKALPRKVSRIILVRDHDRERSSQLRADLATSLPLPRYGWPLQLPPGLNTNERDGIWWQRPILLCMYVLFS